MKKFISLIAILLFAISAFADFSYQPNYYQTCSQGVKSGWQECGATIVYKKYSGQTSQMNRHLSTLIIYNNNNSIHWYCSWDVTNNVQQSSGRDSDGQYWKRYCVEAWENIVNIPIKINIYYYPSTKSYYIELYQNNNEWAVFSDDK